jgi:hypothetical protein
VHRNPNPLSSTIQSWQTAVVSEFEETTACSTAWPSLRVAEKRRQIRDRSLAGAVSLDAAHKAAEESSNAKLNAQQIQSFADGAKG